MAQEISPIPLTELWAMDHCPLPVFMTSLGYAPTTYYKLRTDGIIIPTRKLGRQRFVDVKAAKEVIEALPLDTGAEL